MSTAESIRAGGHRIGLPEGVYLASLGRRLAAFAIDVLAPYVLVSIGVLLIIGDGPNVPAVICLVLPICWAGLLCWMVATKAAGPGMRLLGLQIVGLHDGRPIGVGRALLRGLIISLLGLTVVGLIVGSVVMLLQSRRQGWHDRAVDSVVIEERQLAPPRPRTAAKDRPTPRAEGRTTEEAAATGRTGERVDLVEDGPIDEHQSIEDDPNEDDPHTGDADSEDPPAAPVAATPTAEPDSVAAAPAVASMASPPPDQGWVVVLEDGREIPIQRLVLIGRNPQPRPGEEDARLIKIVDEARTVSKTHLAINLDARGVLVTDRGSTNGSAVTDPDGGYELLTADEPRRITGAGHLISFGKHHVRIGRKN